MGIKLLYMDLRTTPPTFHKHVVDWRHGLTGQEAVKAAMGETTYNQIVQDLKMNNKDLIVSWSNPATQEHSPIGGLGSLDWPIPNSSTLAIVYENENVSEADINASTEWMLAQEEG